MPDEKPRDGRIAIREVYRSSASGLLPTVLRTRKIGQHAIRRRVQIEARESGLSHFPSEQSGCRIGAYAEVVFSEVLVQPCDFNLSTFATLSRKS